MKTIFTRNNVPFNSSSSHCVLIFDEGAQIPSTWRVYGWLAGYHWEDFILSSPQDKQHYALAQLWEAWTRIHLSVWGDESNERKRMEEFTKAYTDEGFYGIIGDLDTHDFPYDGIDHESVWNFPKSSDPQHAISLFSQHFNVAFMKDLFNDIINNPRIVIFGGNDNSDSQASDEYTGSFSEPPKYNVTSFYKHTDYKNCTARKDGNLWVISKDNGGVSIVSFDEAVSKMQYLNVPYLVDVQVTNHCEQGCSFCYRGCSANNEHADERTVRNCIEALFNIGVHNIVLGGGDISKYPAYPYINKFSTKDKTISTTLHYKTFLEQYDCGKLLKFLNGVHGIGVSVSPGISDVELDRLCSIISCLHSVKFDTKEKLLVIQIIPELFTLANIKRVLSMCEDFAVPINLLGYKVFKNSGKNKKLNKDALEYLLSYIKHHSWSVMCDAEFVNKYGDALHESGVNEECITRQDGYGTCFIDLTRKKMALSSYSDIEIDFDITECESKYRWVDMKRFKDWFMQKRKELIEKATK